MRWLFISRYFPTDLTVKTHGLYKRMALFIDAIRPFAGLDMLFYVASEADATASGIEDWRRRLAEHWQADIELFLCHPQPRARSRSRWRGYGQPALHFFSQFPYAQVSGPQQIASFEACLDREPDAIFCHRLEAVCPALRSGRHLPPVFLDLDDIPHVAFARGVGQPPITRSKRLLYLQLPALLWGERRLIRLARRTFVCSQEDRVYLTRRWHLPGIEVVPNAIRIPGPQPTHTASTLAFLGSYTYRPNRLAADFLIERVWPLIRREAPDARLIIAGAHSERLNAYQRPPDGVELPGYVEDLDRLYYHTRIICAPILEGGGTRVKLIEAAAYGKAIVATRVAAEGLGMRDGEDILLRDDPASFAQACVQLLEDSTLCERLGKAARQVAVERFDRDNVVSLIQRELGLTRP